jgi:acyl-CoA synthetase (AMP-forming)/AMP-acid ligase II
VIEAERVTRFIGVPTMVRDMLEHPTFTPERTKTVKNMMAGGAPVPPSQVALMRSQNKGESNPSCRCVVPVLLMPLVAVRVSGCGCG